MLVGNERYDIELDKRLGMPWTCSERYSRPSEEEESNEMLSRKRGGNFEIRKVITVLRDDNKQ